LIDLKGLPNHILQEFIENPVFFIKVVFGEHLWSKQVEIANALVKHKKVAVASCYGIGKSFITSRLVIWFLQTHPNSIIGTTAPSFRQVKNIIWREIHSAYSKARINLLGDLNTTEWNVNRGKWFATGISGRNIDSMQGTHSDYVMAVFDEASGISDEIISAMESWGTGGEFYELMIGNPLRPSGKFYQAFFNPTFYKIQISAFDTPNFTGEKIPDNLRKLLINEKFVEDVELTYGKDSNFYKIAVLGQFPEEAEDGLFSINDIESCIKMPMLEEKTPVCFTIDVAREGVHSTVIAIWKGFNLVDLIEVKKNNFTELSNWIMNLVSEYNPEWITLDTSGMGVGLYDILSSKGLNVYGVQFHENAFEENKYSNVRTEMYFNLANAIREKRVKLIDNDDLKKDLLMQTYEFDNLGRFKLTDKKILAKKNGKSPDFSDAIALRFTIQNNKVGMALI